MPTGGHADDPEDLDHLPDENLLIACPDCGRDHEWTREDAVVDTQSRAVRSSFFFGRIAHIGDGRDPDLGVDAPQLARHAFIAALRPGPRLLMRILRPQDAIAAVDLPTAGRAVQRVAKDIQCVPDTFVRVRDPELGRRVWDGRRIALRRRADVAIGHCGTIGLGALRSLSTRTRGLAAPLFASVGVTVHE